MSTKYFELCSLPVHVKQDFSMIAFVVEDEINLPLEKITIPTIVSHSKEDGLVDFEYGQYTAQHVPNAKFVPFESGGHL